MKETNEGKRGHKLLTQEIRKRLPALYTTEEIPLEEKVAQVKFFSPYNGWRWYAVEFDGEDIFWGYVEGWEKEWGTFSLSELADTTVFGGVPAIERDCFFTPQKVGDILTVA